MLAPIHRDEREMIVVEQMVERPAQQRIARIEGVVEAAPDARVQKVRQTLEQPRRVGPGDVVEVAADDRGHAVVHDDPRHLDEFGVAPGGIGVRNGRFGMDAIEPERPSIAQRDRHDEGGHLLHRQEMHLDIVDGQAGEEDHSIGVVVRARDHMGMALAQRLQPVRPAFVRLHEKSDIRVGLSRHGERPAIIAVRHLHIGRQDRDGVRPVRIAAVTLGLAPAQRRELRHPEALRREDDEEGGDEAPPPAGIGHEDEGRNGEDRRQDQHLQARKLEDAHGAMDDARIGKGRGDQEKPGEDGENNGCDAQGMPPLARVSRKRPVDGLREPGGEEWPE